MRAVMMLPYREVEPPSSARPHGCPSLRPDVARLMNTQELQTVPQWHSPDIFMDKHIHIAVRKPSVWLRSSKRLPSMRSNEKEL